MKWTKVLPGAIFFLVLVVAWRTLGSSGYEIMKGSADYSMKGSAGYSMKNATYYVGGTVATVNLDLDSCKKLCNNTGGCVGFSRRTAADSAVAPCWLKSQLSPSAARATKDWNTYAKPGVLLTEVMQTKKPWPRDHINWTYEAATDYPGNDLGSIAAQDDTSCTDACAKIKGCVGVARQIDRPGNCWFKSAKGKGVFNRNINSIFFS
jgi:hypothetical protein